MDLPLLAPDALDYSRRDTEHGFHRYVLSWGFDGVPGSRGWIHRAMRLRVAERRADRDLAAEIVKTRHYLAGWPARPRTKILTVLASLDGVTEHPSTGAAGLVMITLQPQQYHVARALDLHQCEVLTLSRMWRASDLVPGVAPDFTPELLRRVVRGERCTSCHHAAADHLETDCGGQGRDRSGRARCACSSLRVRGVADLGREWTARKVDGERLRARPRLLATYADPALGHDGATYLAAGATACGPARNGKLLFAWALDDALREPLRQLGAAAAERLA